MRILIVEDETALAETLKKGLEEETYAVDLAFDGEEGLFLAENESYDLIILDIMLPEVDGLTILEKIRKRGVKTPVLMLTAKDTIRDKIKGLDTGADDYLTKPFHFDELLARIRALLRRAHDIKDPVIEISDLSINTVTREVTRAGKLITLTAKEYALLELLALNKGRVLSRTIITEHLYDQNFDLDSNIIDVFINRLRSKIDRDFEKKLIHTIRGAGYTLRD